MNKRAVVDDMFDLIFTVVAAFFILIFVGSALQEGPESSERESLEQLGEVVAKENLLRYLQTGNTTELIITGQKNKVKEVTEQYLLAQNKASLSSITIFFIDDAENRELRISPFGAGVASPVYLANLEGDPYSKPYPASMELLSQNGGRIVVQLN